MQCETLLEEIKIHAGIGIAIENKPAAISALGHVVGSVDRDQVGQTGHGSCPSCGLYYARCYLACLALGFRGQRSSASSKANSFPQR